MYKLYIAKVMIKILQGSVITRTVLGGLTMYPPVVSFVYAKNYESRLAVDKVIAAINRLTFFWSTLAVYCIVYICFTSQIGMQIDPYYQRLNVTQGTSFFRYKP